jgi:hypothetical protein
MELGKFYSWIKQETKKNMFQEYQDREPTQLIHMHTQNYQHKQYIHPVKREVGLQFFYCTDRGFHSQFYLRASLTREGKSFF